jgi:hypothetical protein
MRKIIEGIAFFLDKLAPIALISLSIYIYFMILQENKRLSKRIDYLGKIIEKNTQDVYMYMNSNKTKE